MKGKIVSLNVSDKKGTIKHAVASVILRGGHGIEGDAHAGPWHRQVSFLDESSVDKMRVRGARNLVPGIFAENITTEGIDLYHLPIGTQFRIRDAVLELTQIGKECHQHCQIYQQVGMCIMPTEGIFARVLKGDEVFSGDEIEVVLPMRAIVITLSDKGAAGIREDKSGPALAEALSGKATVVRTVLLPDDKDALKKELIRICDSHEADLILTTGGTGLAPRDFTPEVTLSIMDKRVPGMAEAMRAASMLITPKAMLSRAEAVIRKQTLIVNLPGSPKAALENLSTLMPALPHAIETLRGEAYECAG